MFYVFMNAYQVVVSCTAYWIIWGRNCQSDSDDRGLVLVVILTTITVVVHSPVTNMFQSFVSILHIWRYYFLFLSRLPLFICMYLQLPLPFDISFFPHFFALKSCITKRVNCVNSNNTLSILSFSWSESLKFSVLPKE